MRGAFDEGVLGIVAVDEPVASFLVGDIVSRRNDLLAARAKDGLEFCGVAIARSLNESDESFFGRGIGALSFGLGE